MKFSLAFLVALALSGAVNVRSIPLRNTNELNEIFQEFLALVPVEDVTALFLEYLEKDAEVQAVVEYVQTEDFKELVKKVESIEDVIAFYDFMQESGLDIYDLVNSLHEVIGLPPLVPGQSARKMRITGGIAGLIADIKAMLPLDDIKALYHEKLESSAAFAELVERFQSPRFQELIDALRANEEFQKILHFAKQHGVDVKAITDLLSSVLGLEFPNRFARSAAVNARSISLRNRNELNEIFQEFLALVPVEDVAALFLEYLEKDAEVQAVVEYVQTEDFKELVKKVESIEDVIAFYDFMQESGLDIYGLVNSLHEAIGLPPLVPGQSARNMRITGGIAGLIADIKAMLPLDDIKALYHEKLESSAAFAELVERFQSPRFQELIDALRANEEFQKILHFAKQHGVDVKAITDLLSSVLGLEFPDKFARSSRSLVDDFADFAAILPTEEIARIAMDYYENDPAIQQVYEYMQSDAFRNLVVEIEAMKELKNLFAYLQESGLDVYGFLANVHEIFGIPPYQPFMNARKNLGRLTGGIAGYVADIKAILPMDKIKALYYEKLETSPDFKKFIDRLSSPEFQNFVNAVFANEEARAIIHKLEANGLDLAALGDLFTTILGLHFPKPVRAIARNDLSDDLADFIALLPMDEIVEIATDYLSNDKEIAETIEYLQSPEFHKVVIEVEAMKEARDVLAFLEESGLDAYAFLNSIHDMLGIPPFKPFALSNRHFGKASGGLAGLIADIKAILPIEEIKALYYQKLENSPSFIKLIKRLSSPEFQEFVDAVLAKEEALIIIGKLKEHGVDLGAIADLVSQILGLHFPRPVRAIARNDLKDDLADFLALLPMDEIVEIATDYLSNDKEIAETIEYLQSPEFHKIVVEVEAMKEARDVLAFLEESGLDAYAFLNSIHDMLGIPPFKPFALSNRHFGKASGGLAGLIADIKAILPIAEIKALYYQKLENSPSFIKLIKRLSSPEFQEFVDAVLAKEEALIIIGKLKEHGVDLGAIADLVSQILGLHFPKPVRAIARNDLKDDLADFLALLPMDEIVEIATDYLSNDKEIAETIEYLQSPEFHKIVVEVEAMKEARDVLAFLEESGLDAYAFLNSIHDMLGIPPFKPFALSNRHFGKASGGLAGLIADIKAILPIAEIKALYYQKLENSPSFIKLIKRLSSPEFQEFVDAVLAKEEALIIIGKLKEHGVDLGAIADLVSQILGLHFPKPVRAIARNDLKDDLADFLALLPMDEIVEIATDYLSNDKEIAETIEYLQSPEFHKIVVEVEAMKEARDVLAFLEESGLDAYAFLNSIHDMLGIPPFKPFALSNRHFGKASGGLAGLIADIKAILPIEEIKALYYQKLENSPSFIKLIKRLSSPEFQEFVDAVLAKEEALIIIGKLKEHGVDLGAIADLVSQILGLHFPKPMVRVSRALDHMSEQLRKDLREFINLLPVQKIVDIGVDYLFNDAEVQRAAVYIKSSEFKQIAIPAQQNREFKKFLKYLDDSWLPASFYMNKLNVFLGIPEVHYEFATFSATKSKRDMGGVRGMVDAIEAILPREEIKALFEHKKKNSEAFKYMIERLAAQEFQDIVDELSLNEDFRTLGYEAASYGINLDTIVDFLGRVFGIVIHNPPSLFSLDDDLQEFVNLMPAKQIRRIVARYYLLDKEVKAAVAYSKSEEFRQLVRDLHDIPEYNDLLKSLEMAGLDVQSYIKQIHDFIGFKGFRFSREGRKTNGVAGLVAEIKATLPIDDIKALYEKKLETSEDFAGLVELIKSDKFQAVTDALFANKIFQDILHRLQAHGIDLKVVSDFFLTVFGITTPPGVIDFFARF